MTVNELASQVEFMNCRLF